jgi:A/G-specific adenine glycosylase
MLLPELKKFYIENGRGHLPWRKSHDPYRVLVSEVMLQQTQVERVQPKYREFVRAFPNFKALAKAPFSQVLFHWSGLGYNRRAKFLHDAAKAVVKEYGGMLPTDVAHIEKLPGIGPYTARAVAAFANNEPNVFIETNIRTVFTLYYFPAQEKVSDAELLPLIERDLRSSKMEPRDFYAALMDYGSFLKKSGVRINRKSAQYVPQTKFEGSARQLRGALLRELLVQPQSAEDLGKKNGHQMQDIGRELARLEKEGLITKKGNTFSLAK